MTPAMIATSRKESPLLFEGLTWREFKAVEQLLDRPGYRLSFLDGVLEIRRMPGEPHETVKRGLLRCWSFTCSWQGLTLLQLAQ
jgi:Uma2 family endonuclease